MEMNEMIEMIRFLYSRNLETHIDTTDGSFYNGLITELLENSLIIQDRFLGETLILHSQIEIIERFRK